MVVVAHIHQWMAIDCYAVAYDHVQAVHVHQRGVKVQLKGPVGKRAYTLQGFALYRS